MMIYALVHPASAKQPCIQAFSTPELAHSARILYGWNELEVVEMELFAQEEDLRNWSRSGSPVHLYFIPSDTALGRSYKAFADVRSYKEQLDVLDEDLPWLDGTLDGLRRSVELGLLMYRIHMDRFGAISTIESGHAFGATTTMHSTLNLLDTDRGRYHIGNCADEATGRYFIYVFATDQEAAVAIAQPLLEQHRRRPAYQRL